MRDIARSARDREFSRQSHKECGLGPFVKGDNPLTLGKNVWYRKGIHAQDSAALRGFIAQRPLERRVGRALLETLQLEPSGRQRQTSEEP